MSVIDQSCLDRDAVRTPDRTDLTVDLLDDIPTDFPLPLDFDDIDRAANLHQQVDLTPHASAGTFGLTPNIGTCRRDNRPVEMKERDEIAIVVDDQVLERKPQNGVISFKLLQ